eukprot:3622587-Heterocapsa_arctica.AAC.1
MDRINNLNVCRQQEAIKANLDNAMSLSEVARLNDQLRLYATNGEEQRKVYAASSDEQSTVIASLSARVVELESILEKTANADETGIEILKQQIAEMEHGLETDAGASAARELRIAELLA